MCHEYSEDALKAIILAAGQGTRLRPLTNDRPKCMVPFNGKPLIDSLIDRFRAASVTKIAVVTGYKSEILREHLGGRNIEFFENSDFATTNMVETLFSAESFFDDDLIISYADILFDQNVLNFLLKSDKMFSVVIDRDWLSLWKMRMENPLDDAETLKIEHGKIVEIGEKAVSEAEISGQYIGLVKVGKDGIDRLCSQYRKLRQVAGNAEQLDAFKNMYMTRFIQSFIDGQVCDISPVFIDGGWLEIDSMSDLVAYEKHQFEIG